MQRNARRKNKFPTRIINNLTTNYKVGRDSLLFLEVLKTQFNRILFFGGPGGPTKLKFHAASRWAQLIDPRGKKKLFSQYLTRWIEVFNKIISFSLRFLIKKKIVFNYLRSSWFSYLSVTHTVKKKLTQGDGCLSTVVNFPFVDASYNLRYISSYLHNIVF